MTKYNHDIGQYVKWLNEGKTYDEMAKLTGIDNKSIIYKWIRNNYILEKKTVYTAKKKRAS